jgi:hypothetical protein
MQGKDDGTGGESENFPTPDSPLKTAKRNIGNAGRKATLTADEFPSEIC